MKVPATARVNALHSLEVKRKCLEHEGDVAFVFAQDDDVLDGFAGITGYVADFEGLPPGVRIGISLDRFLGKR